LRLAAELYGGAAIAIFVPESGHSASGPKDEIRAPPTRFDRSMPTRRKWAAYKSPRRARKALRFEPGGFQEMTLFIEELPW
jgi:hypothetical protein